MVIRIVDKVSRQPYKLKNITLKNRQTLKRFYSMIVDGKNEFFKKLWFVLRRGMFSAFLVDYNVRLTGIKLKRY